MGIPKLYEKVGPGERISLSKLAVQHYEKTGRKLRLAIDASIWLFQVKASRGGANPELRTIYFRLVRLLKLGIDPVFVFDGSGRPIEKRNKKIERSWESPRVIQARRLLDLFGFVHHQAPGEAEAECAFLQREKYVDLILSEDSDTLMFGATKTIRNWSSQERRGSKAPTHVNLLDAKKIKSDERLSREGMILVGLMSGGDYDTVGIKGCGSTTAYEAATAGFGNDLCDFYPPTHQELSSWRERLKHELRTNESGFFSKKHPSIADSIRDSFPCKNILEFYICPLDSSLIDLSTFSGALESHRSVDVLGLRAFVGEKLEWKTRPGALKFIRSIAPAIATSRLLESQDISNRPNAIVRVCGTRTHFSSDGIPEVRVDIRPIDLVPIDFTAEPIPSSAPAIHYQVIEQIETDEESQGEQDLEYNNLRSKAEASVRKEYNPEEIERHYIAEYYVRSGAPSQLEDFERAIHEPKHTSPRKPRSKKPQKTTGMPEGAIKNYFNVSKGSFGQSSPSEQGFLEKKPAGAPRSKNPPSARRPKSTAAKQLAVPSSVNPWTMAKSNLYSKEHSNSVPHIPNETQNACFTSKNNMSDSVAVGIDAHPDKPRPEIGKFAGYSYQSNSPSISSVGVHLQSVDPPSKILIQQTTGVSKASVRIRESLPGSWSFEEGEPSSVNPSFSEVDIIDLS